MDKVGYLGPEGTFTEEALEANLGDKIREKVPFQTVPDVLRAIESNEVDAGFVPMENSIEGSVNITLDTLAFETHLYIEGEFVHPVSHMLVAKKGVGKREVKSIISHPQATAQCRNYLVRNFPDLRIAAANSTAEAALTVSKGAEPLAAITTEFAAQIYGLEILERDIQDYASNETRFVLVGRSRSPKTGNDKTSLACFIRENRPGSLLEILQEFASRQINLTKIESRPTKKALGDYFFFIDIEGHVEDEPIKDALGSLMGKLREIRILGSYPAAAPTSS
ncbi:MAG: prephenate dehydratase [Actinomycetota bacterium]|nr:prephenate dehydratase [Actinomycetota bacterium]